MLLFIQRFLIANINNNYTNKNNTLNIMGFNIISAAEAASYIKHGYNIGLSGFTPAGTPKAVTPEVAKIAEEEHAKGNPFQISIFTGASTGDATDGILSRVKAIRYRAPYTTNVQTVRTPQTPRMQHQPMVKKPTDSPRKENKREDRTPIRLSTKEEARRAFIYSEIFNRKY